MSRAPRIHFPGAIYHVINRGNDKGNIFIDEKDYNVFLKHIREVKQEKDFFLYCYCLMPNHFHLLLEVKDEPLPKIMQNLLISYTKYFNARYDKSGHLFQGRYKAIICGTEEYLLRLIRYIHLNPKRAHLIEDISEYKWSSHNNYSGKADNKVLSTEKLFERMGETFSSGYRVYNNLLKDEDDKFDEEFKKSYESNILGSDDFIKEMKENYNIKKIETEENIFKINKLSEKITMDEILEKIAMQYEISKDDILSDSQNRVINRARKMFYYEASQKYDYKTSEISNFIKRHSGVVCKGINEIKAILSSRNSRLTR